MNSPNYAPSYCVGTLTLGASATQTVTPILADNAYKNVSITVTPMESFTNYRYTVDLYIDGARAERHAYTALNDRPTAHMDYYHKVFPPNVGVATNPKIFSLGGYNEGDWDIGLVGFTLIVTNNEAERRSFLIYGTFEEFQGMPTFKPLEFDF